MNDLLRDLTPAQAEAVTHMNGPMLVVAGAGSGKTRVVTRRVAHLIAKGVPNWRILALTFTNKAAREMRERVEQLVGDAPAWMGTFHSICARILRADMPRLNCGRDGRFTIMDQGDQEGIVKQAMKRLDIDDKSHRPSAILGAISRHKSDNTTPDDVPTTTPRDRVVQEVYAAYEEALRDNNAVDFDDLLLYVARLFKSDADALRKYQARFPYILVDEYQDTNRAQYSLLKALAGTIANIHATGDPDQSIYSWRGADYQNIMDFQRDFPGAKVVRLEENYRSSRFILGAANGLIRHNTHRIDKELFTSKQGGEKVQVVRTQSDRMEAQFIVDQMRDLRDKGQRLGEMAAFYRTNAQSRSLEEALLGASLPYQLVGGVRFYERREIKDAIAHLKVRINPRDLASLRRVLGNRPGIGEKTLEKIAESARQADEPVFSFLASPDFPSRYKAPKKVADFARWCHTLAGIDTSRADIAVREILRHSALVESTLANAHKDELADDRVDNLTALEGRAQEFVRLRLENAPDPGPDATDEEIRAAGAIDLAAFLEDVALVADIDGWATGEDKVTLMTLHSAKGLEFDNVFVTGLEEGILPHRNCSDDASVEEERRLFYVGLTRARERAWVTHAETRYMHGSVDFARASRFLEELPMDMLTALDFGDATSPVYGSGYTRRGRAVAWEDDVYSDGNAAGDGDFDIDPGDDFDIDFDPGFDGEFSADPDDMPVKKAWPKRQWPGKKQTAPVKAPSKFKPGDLVRHPAFGSGKVLTSDRKKIMVQFFESGTRLLHEDLSQLTRE